MSNIYKLLVMVGLRKVKTGYVTRSSAPTVGQFYLDTTGEFGGKTYLVLKVLADSGRTVPAL